MKTMVSTAGGACGPIETPDALLPGAKAGPWVVERELGRGGMGAVYAVVHEEIGKRAALKIVHSRLLIPGFNVDRMILEAKLVNQVGHPNIVDIFETGHLPDGRPYIVMERLDGQPLSYRADEGKILPDQVITILLQICDALIAAHAAGVVHRDLKLDNIFLVDNAEDPGTPKVKLLDWGIAKDIHHDVKHTIEGQLVGTPQYLSPEQARGASVTPQSDVYSLGVMAYELFLEQLPFEAETAAEVMAMHLRATPPNPADLWPDIPPQLQALILGMLAKSPDHRPTTLEVARGLETVRTELHRRRNAFVAATLVSVEAPRAARMVSSRGLAPTIDATAVVNKRWQYAVGVLAIVASATLFLISRTGDSAAATAAQPAEVRAAGAATVQPPTPAATHATATHPTPEPEATVPATRSALQATRPTVRPTTLSASRFTSMAHRPSSRKAPVAPRRATKIDPDGTLDPYR